MDLGWHVVGYVQQNGDETPGIVTSRPRKIHEAMSDKFGSSHPVQPSSYSAHWCFSSVSNGRYVRMCIASGVGSTMLLNPIYFVLIYTLQLVSCRYLPYFLRYRKVKLTTNFNCGLYVHPNLNLKINDQGTRSHLNISSRIFRQHVSVRVDSK